MEEGRRAVHPGNDVIASTVDTEINNPFEEDWLSVHDLNVRVENEREEENE